MKVKCVAHLAYYMFAAVGVAAESTGDATSLRLNALEETVSTLLEVISSLEGAITNMKEENKQMILDNNALREQLTVDNDANEEAISSLKGEFKEDNKVLRNELDLIRSRRTTSTTGLDKCLKVVGEKKKLVIKCKTDFSKPALFKKPVRIANDVRIIKGNLMITNGGNFTELNGKGNLVIGASVVTQAGTHNIVVGDTHTFSSYGGLVVGLNNTVSGPFSAVTGGWKNTASGYISAVSGGFRNEASGYYSSVSGGDGNVASGGSSAVSGGNKNVANSRYSTVIGGKDITTSNDWDVVGQTPIPYYP